MGAVAGNIRLGGGEQAVDGVPYVAGQLVQAVLRLLGVENAADDVGAPDDLSVERGLGPQQLTAVQVVGVEDHRGGADVDGAAVEHGRGVPRLYRDYLAPVGDKGDFTDGVVGNQPGKAAQQGGGACFKVCAAVLGEQLTPGKAALGDGGGERELVGGAALGDDGGGAGELRFLQINRHVSVHDCPAGEDGLPGSPGLHHNGAFAAGAPSAAHQVQGKPRVGAGLGKGFPAAGLVGHALVDELNVIHRLKPP